MRKLVAMVLALCMVMCCVPAFATLTLPEIPPTMTDVPGAERPEMPPVTLDVVDDHYVLTIEGVEDATWVYVSIWGVNEDNDTQYIQFDWHPEEGKSISEALLDAEYSQDQTLHFVVYHPEDDGFSAFDIDLETGAQVFASLGIWGDENIYYDWYDEEELFIYEKHLADGGECFVSYDTSSGKINFYSVQVDETLRITYSRFGQITGAQIYDWEQGYDYYWDSWAKQWCNMEDGSVVEGLPALEEADYPAPYAEPYIVVRPSDTLDGLDLTAGELYEWEDGSIYYSSQTGSALYDADGNLQFYSYRNLEGDKYVRYSAGNVLEWASIALDDGGYYWYNQEKGWNYEDAEGNVTALESAPEGMMDDMPPLGEPVAPAEAVEYIWYDNNTVGLVGLSLRDMGVTDKWYNVVPVDLTQDGVQTLDLVGSNLFHIGKAFVTVQDGQVTVDYELFPGQSYLKDECVQWFTALEDITADFLSNPASDVAFGQALSIADDLGGAETAILFICNHVTYRQPYNGDAGYLSRYWPNRQRWIDYRAELTELLEGMSK